MANCEVIDQPIAETVVAYFLDVFTRKELSSLAPFSSERPIGLLGDSFVFSLHALHNTLFVNNHEISQPTIDFITFRQAIYASNINQQLAERGCQLALYQSKGKLADNLYQLMALD